MWSTSRITSLTLSFSFFVTQIAAAPHVAKRDDSEIPTVTGPVLSTPGTVITTPTPTLEPVLPPSHDPTDFDILNPDTRVQLFYAGVPDGKSSKRSDDGGTILASLDFSMKRPVVPLDHSSLVSSVVCPMNGVLVGTFSGTSAYQFAEKTWKEFSNLVFITATEGCGPHKQNDVFQAASISFSSSDLSFKAMGYSTGFQKAMNDVEVKWGNAAPGMVTKRAAHKRFVSFIFQDTTS